ncbi:MAG: glycosyltransferase family 87 protein [Hyphomonadaceae bacterium]
MPVKRWAFEVAAVLIAASMLAFFVSRALNMDNMTLPSGQPFFGDFMAFWSAGRAALDGHVAEIHERAMLWPLQQATAPDVKYYAPWNSPPTFLLIVSVLGLMPYPVAAVAFLLGTTLFFLYAIRRFLPDTRALIFPATAPTLIYQIGTVQAGMLIAGIVGMALRWLDKRPIASGAMIALLAIKPHLAVLWPLLLGLSGRWRVFVAAAVATIVFVALAGFVFGFESYGRWFESLANSQGLISQQRITTPAYASLYANLLGLGLSQTIAIALHALSAVLGVLIACVVFRTKDVALSGAALCAATLLVSPYLFFYDFTMLLIGAALLGAPRTPLEYAAAIFAWSAALTVAIGAFIALPVCPLAAWLVLAVAFIRSRNEASLPAPAPQL